MDAIPNPRYSLEPSFCPVHVSPAPCLYCLQKRCKRLIQKYHKDKELEQVLGMLFIQADLNQN